MSRRANSHINYSFPFHVSARCINRDWFELPMPLVWDLMERHLFFIKHAFELRILSFVLMANHFHMILYAPNKNLSDAMAFFLREVSRGLGHSSHRINHTFSSRFFRSNVIGDRYLMHCYKYVYRNPIVVGQGESVLDYKWSTLPGLLGRQQLVIPVEDSILFSEVEETLKWLDTPADVENWNAVRKALKHPTFTLPQDRKTKGMHILETKLL